jgi:two-component system cell cycle response regulator DivK
MTKALVECKVLLVEDVYEARLLVRQIMGRLGVTLVEATDGAEGVAMAKAERPDLILMDLSLPLLDGWEASRRIKADPATARIPIVIVTAHSMADELKQVHEIGCTGYVTKPLNPSGFGRYVERLLLDGEVSPWLLNA